MSDSPKKTIMQVRATGKEVEALRQLCSANASTASEQIRLALASPNLVDSLDRGDAAQLAAALNDAGHTYNAGARQINRVLRRSSPLSRFEPGDWATFISAFLAAPDAARQAAGDLMSVASPVLARVADSQPIKVDARRRPRQAVGAERVSVRLSQTEAALVDAICERLEVSRAAALRLLVNLSAAPSARRVAVSTSDECGALAVAVTRWRTNRDQVLDACKAARADYVRSRYLSSDQARALAVAADEAAEAYTAAFESSVAPIASVSERLLAPNAVLS